MPNSSKKDANDILKSFTLGPQDALAAKHYVRNINQKKKKMYCSHTLQQTLTLKNDS